MTRTRFPSRVYEHGSEPDPRFSLANERTFLAWIRTALALMAGGVAIEAFTLPVHPAFRSVAALLLVVSGIAAAGQAWWTWAATERAMRAGEPLPSAAIRAPLALAVALAGAALVVGAVL